MQMTQEVQNKKAAVRMLYANRKKRLKVDILRVKVKKMYIHVPMTYVRPFDIYFRHL